MEEGTDAGRQIGNRIDHTLDHTGNPVNQPLNKVLPPLKCLSGQSRDKLIADEKPPETTEYTPERADPIPETIIRKAETAASFSDVAILTTELLIPCQRDTAVCFRADQIWETNCDNADNAVCTPCLSPEAADVTTCRIPLQIFEAAFWILVQIFAASEASCVKFPVTRSISNRTGARITFFSSSQAPEAISQILTRSPAGYFSHSPTGM